MISEELVIRAAAESKLEVSDQEVENALSQIKEQNQLDDDELAEALRVQGYTMSGYRKDVRKQILRMRAVNTLVRPKVEISDEEVRAAYDAAGRRSSAAEEVKLQQILIALPSDPSGDELASARARASEVISLARGGADFAELAARYSEDATTKDVGGELGWIGRGALNPEWEAVIFSMEKGDTRGPVRGPQGLHVFHVGDLKVGERPPYEEAAEALKNDMFAAEMDRQTRLWIDDLRNKAYIDVKL